LPPLEKLASEASSNRTAINFLKGIISEAMWAISDQSHNREMDVQRRE
jgi:hypothetical protein